MSWFRKKTPLEKAFKEMFGTSNISEAWEKQNAQIREIALACKAEAEAQRRQLEEMDRVRTAQMAEYMARRQENAGAVASEAETLKNRGCDRAVTISRPLRVIAKA